MPITHTTASQEGDNTFTGNETHTGTETFVNETVSGSITPSSNATSSLGATNKGWADIVLAGGPYIDIRAYGGDPTGTNDNVAALAAAAAAALTAKVREIFFPSGKYLFNSKPAALPLGILLRSQYNPGSAFNQGATLVANYTESTPTNGFISWDSTSNNTFAGGGGLVGLDIQQATGKTGGACIKVVCVAADRPSFLKFEDLRVSGDISGGGGTWAYNFYGDGLGNTTVGSSGLRDIYIKNCWFFNATTSNQSMFLTNVTHFIANGLVIVPGGGSNSGITITGTASANSQSTNVDFASVECLGNLVLDFVTNFTAAGCYFTNVSCTVNTTFSSFNGISANAPTIAGQLAFTSIDPASPSGWGILLTSYLRSVGYLIAGPGIPANAAAGDVIANTNATTGVFKFGSDGLCILRRISATLLQLTFDAAVTIPFAWDNVTGFTNKTQNTIQTANAGQWIQGQNSELLTLSTSGATTDTVGNLLPANSIIEAVVARVTTTITTATDWKLGDATQAARFTIANATLVSGTTTVGLNQADPTVATANLGPVQTSAAKVRVTTTGTPGAGAIRITVFYRQFVAPTS